MIEFCTYQASIHNFICYYKTLSFNADKRFRFENFLNDTKLQGGSPSPYLFPSLSVPVFGKYVPSFYVSKLLMAHIYNSS